MKALISIGLFLISPFCLSAQSTFNIQNHKGGVINHKTVVILKNRKVKKPLLDTESPNYEINLDKDFSATIIQVKNIGNENAYILSDKCFMVIEFTANNSYHIPNSIPLVASNESFLIGINQIKKFNAIRNLKKILEFPIERFKYRYFLYFKLLYSDKNKKDVISLHKIYEIHSLRTNGKFHETDSMKYQGIKKCLITKKQW